MNKCIQRSIFRLIIVSTLAILCRSSASGQAQNQYDKGTPPQFAAGVSSFGSYTSSDIGVVNLSNGALTLKIPLANVGGRGMSLPITLNWSSKIWSASIDYDREHGLGRGGDDGNPSMVPLAYADYDAASVYANYNSRIEAGWSIGGMPFFTQRVVRINYTEIQPQGPCYHWTLPKLSFTMPDGGEIEFRDDNYDGAPLPSDCGGWTAIASRGHRWHATDGSGTIFINDPDNGAAGRFPDLTGVVVTADGTRFYINAGGGCYLIRDRNGNQISTNGNSIIDPLGRATTIQQNVPDPETGEGLAVLVTVTGYAGQPRYFKVKSGTMNQHYRSDINPNLPVLTGSYDPMSWGYDAWWPSNATRLFQFSYGLFVQRIDDRPVIYQLTLPDHRSMYFNYNAYGEVAEIQMPTGGKVWYDYDATPGLPSGNSPVFETAATYHTTVPDVDRGVTQRRTFPDGLNLEGNWTYSYGNPTVVACYAADGTMLSNQAHFFLPSGRYTEYASSNTGLHDGSYYNLWSTGVEWRTETRDAANNVITATEHDWTQRTPVSWNTYTQEQPANDNRVNQTRHYLDDGSFAKTETSYDGVNYPRANNVSEMREYDFDGSLKRRTTTSYAPGNYQNDDSIHLLRLPVTQTVFDGSGNQAAQSTNEYDNYTNDSNHSPLLDYGSIVGHDNNYSGLLTARGNVTASGQWLNTNNSTIYAYTTYDILGNPLTHKDARGNVTSISYNDDFGDGSSPGGGGVGAYGQTYALPTLLTSPSPQPGQAQHTARSQYDFSTGLLTGFKDQNGIVTQTIYGDPFERPTLIKSALGVSGVENHTRIYYAPQTTEFGITLNRNDVLTAKDQTVLDDKVLRSWTVTDGFGRIVESWSRDPQGDDQVITKYDALSRAKQVSNPFRPSAGQSPIFTTTAFDLAGRIASVTTPDSAVVNTYYNGSQVLVKDQAGKERMSQTNALGRLTDVWEITPTDQWTVSVSFPNHGEVTSAYHTIYGFDTLDNLTSVTQGTQPQRTFVYDSLKRLTSAKNPEMVNAQGVQVPVTYQYDNNGNLSQKTDARGVLSTYGYDALNRNTSITYSDGTPTITRVYDGATTGIGRLYYQWTAASDTTKNFISVIDAYDAAGRPKNWRQHFWVSGNWGTPYAMSGNYDLAGHLRSMSYPSGHSVSYDFDMAGRNNDFRGYLGDNSLRIYSTAITYSPLGGLAQEQFGTSTAIYNKLFYNSRGQLAEIRDGLSANDTSWQRGAIINFYGDNCWGMCGGENSTTPMGHNNGNLKTQAIFVPNDDAEGYEGRASSFAEGFDYDALNRLRSVQEGSWRQQYSYDRYGNRTLDQANTYGAGIPNPYFGVDQNTNRLTPAGGYTMTYDSAGNLINDNYTGQGQRIFDAENRMTAAQGGVNGQWQNYYYDPNGQRVKRIVNGVETWQIYGVGGELLAEYSANASPSLPQKEYGYRNGQLLITATGPGYIAENKTNVSDASKNLIARAKIEKLPWEKNSSLNDNAISDTSTPLYASAPLMVQSPSQPIVFASNRDGTDQIYLMNSDGTNQTRLTNNAANDDAPRWSYNNAKIVFQSDRDNPFSGIADIYSMNADGSAQTRLTTDPNDDSAPAWSPDGSKIAFQSQRNGVYYQIYVMNADGSGQVNISNTGANDTQPCWSPDGSKIAFASDRDHAGYPSVYVMNANGSGQTRLTFDNAPYSDDQPSWSPDGMHIAFTSTRDSTIDNWTETDDYEIPEDDGQTFPRSRVNVNKEVYVMNANGSGQTRLTNTLENDESPSWSSDSSKIVFRADRERDNFDPTPQVWVMNSDGSGQIDLSNNTGGDYSPSWQQSGNPPPTPTPTPTPTPSGPSPVGVHWLVTDQLGTPRMIFDETGNLAKVSRHDLLPFGEELGAGTGGRTQAQGYGQIDGVRQQFTGQQRDNETGLDYFGARYFASTQGRFTSPDPLPASAHLARPQTWNRYSYAVNNPLRLIDPTGLEDEDPQDPKVRVKTTTTVVDVQERTRSGQIVQHAQVTITETQNQVTNAQGDWIDVGNKTVTANAVNVGDGQTTYSNEQLKTMEKIGTGIVEVANEKGFDATIMLGIARTETHFGTLKSGESAAFKQSDVNPTQLSAGSGLERTTDLKHNIEASMVHFNRGLVTDNLNQSLQNYNNEPGKKEGYAKTAEGYIKDIRNTVHTTYSPPRRLMEMTRP